MFTCDNCQRQRPDRECVSINRRMGYVVEVMAPLKVSVVCRRCSGRVMKLGIVALAGLLVIALVTVLLLNLAVYNI